MGGFVDNPTRPMQGDAVWPSEVFDDGCTQCPRLAGFLADSLIKFPRHYCKPVPPFGAQQAQFLIVGLAPGLHGANRTGRPFTGDYCGPLLYGTLNRHGFAVRPDSEHVGDGQQLINARVSNAVKCVPPENKPLPAEIRTCNGFIKAELTQLKPKVVLALGLVAHQAVVMATGGRQSAYKFGHAAQFDMDMTDAMGQPHRFTLLDSYHVSRYNTQTRRLTEAMFDEVVATVARMLAT